MSNKSKKKALIDEYNRLEEEEARLEEEEQNREHIGEDGYPVEHDEDGVPIEHDEDGIPIEHDEDGVPIEEDEDGNPLEEDESGVPIEEDEEESPPEDDSDDSIEENTSDEDDNDTEDPQDTEKSKDAEKDKEDGSPGKTDSEARRKLGPRQQKEPETPKGDSKSDKDGLKDKALDAAKGKLADNKVVEQASKIKAAATSAASAIKSSVLTLLNPLFWKVVAIIAAVVLIGITLISITDVVGQNDYNKLCDQNGVGSVMIDDDADDYTRQSAIASWLMSTPFEVLGGQPMSREQAMGVMGNFIEESGGANPKHIQSGYADWETCDNDCVEAFVGGGKAVGILQWDGQDGDPRRDNLVKLAKAEGGQWYDLNIQLKHIKQELDAEGDHTYENTQIKKSGFLEPGKTIEEYTLLWSEYIERCGTCRNEDRVASANAFNAEFNGAVSGLSSQCVGGLAASSNITELAAQIAWTREEKAAGKGYGSCNGYHQCGLGFSKPEYIELKRRVEADTGRDSTGEDFLASCDILVATLIRGSGIDVNFPYVNSDAQIAYMEGQNGWERVSCQTRQPGDVFGESGHVMIYVGEIDGQDTMVSASHTVRSAHMANISCVGDQFKGDALTVQGWRKVN